MKKLFLILFALLFVNAVIACTVYKITMHGKTFMGNNEDYWNPHTRIWFEKGKNGSYGCSYVGFAHLYPEGGINEKGLAFDGFSVPRGEIKKNINSTFAYDTTTLRKVMQSCQNTDEVYTFLSKYDFSRLNGGMLLFVDPSGKYLVVEADTMIKGNDDKYLLSNFCPSKTKDVNDVKIPMYQSGRKLMASHVDTSLAFLKTLSDTLHQSWPGNIGGTLYTTIYDLNERTIHLYFYHDYTKSVTFKLADELNKEDRVVVNIPKLFSNNIEGQDQLKRYNLTQDFFLKLKAPSFSKDSLKIANYICINDIEPFLPLYEGEINNIGCELMDKKKLTSAINVFKLNLKYHKNSWNAFDSLAEAYFNQKNFKESKIYYQKSLALNPNNQSAIGHLKILDK